MNQIAILGRLDKLGLAELLARHPDKVVSVHNQFVELSKPIKDPQNFGGLIRLCEVVGKTRDTSWRGFIAEIERTVGESYSDGKVKLAVNTEGIKLNPKRQQADLLEMKKRLRKAGLSIRLIMASEGRVNAAQVKANKLTAEGNFEFMSLKIDDELLVLRSTWVQDVDDYAARDYDRPKRDGFVGMLPPKLTQIMLNLAQAPSGGRVLDPFCGTGVVLQEALLMGYSAFGSDLSDRMVDYSQKNLRWLADERGELPNWEVEAGDAQNHQWKSPIDAVVSEVYLGEPQRSIPNESQLRSLLKSSEKLLSAFLENLNPQLKSGTPIVLAIPAWKTHRKTWVNSPVIDSLNRLGYTRTSFSGVSQNDLLYFRPDQFVARRLVVLTKK